MDLTKEAARATAEALPPVDLIAVIVFDSQATPVVRLQRASNRQRILDDIARITASGGTNILSGLREAVDELLPARARKKHIILLSDGQSPYDEIPDLIDAASAARITVSAVGVGDGADQTLLKMIANRGGGRFYHTRDPASIPRIFSRETSELGDRAIVERPTTARAAKRVAALAGVPLETAPALGGYVVTRPRPQAETILATADGDAVAGALAAGAGSGDGVDQRSRARAGRRRGRAGRRSTSCGRSWRARPCAGAPPPTSRSAPRAPATSCGWRSTRWAPTTGSWSGLDGARRRDEVAPGRPAAAAAHAGAGRDRARPLRGQLPPRHRIGRAAVHRRGWRRGGAPDRGGRAGA